jgi:hypothetical protein
VVPEDAPKAKDKDQEKAKGKEKSKDKGKDQTREADQAKEADKDKGPLLLMVMRFPTPDQAREMAALLGVPYRPTRGKAGQDILAFRLVETSLLGDTFGRDQRYADLPMRMRSLREVLDYLGQGVEVPSGNRAVSTAGQVPLAGGGELVDPYVYVQDLFSVRQTPTKPEGAMVAVPYRHGWYYIADADLRSKLVFSFLSTLLALQSGNPPAHAPLLTLPVGGS